MFLPLRELSSASKAGSNSVSSSCSLPMAGQPNATAENSENRAGENSPMPIRTASPPAALTPSSMHLAMASVLPVPLQ